jgi:cellobiose phosphorylase
MAEDVYNRTDTFWEFYHSETGQIDDVVGKTGWAPASNYTGWDGLLTNLFIENLIGIKYNRSTIDFQPIIPHEWNGSQITLQLSNLEINLSLLNTLINASIHLTYPFFNNVTIINLDTFAQNTFLTADFQTNFTNFNRYRFLIK